MQESVKALLGLGFIVGAIGALLIGVMPLSGEPRNWKLFAIFAGVAAVTLAILLKLQFRADREPDFLRAVCRLPFDVDGLCFIVVPTTCDGLCRLLIVFQNRYERRCRSEIVLRAGRQFMLNRRKVESIRVAVEADGGELGALSVPWPIPAKAQGKKQALEVGAAVEYPDGRGRWLRSREGAHVGKISMTGTQAVLTLAAAMGGSIVWHSPAHTSIRLPRDVAEEVSDDEPIQHVTIWKPGDDATTAIDQLAEMMQQT